MRKEPDSSLTRPKELLRRDTPHGVLIGLAVDDACARADLPQEERAIAAQRADHVRGAFVAGRLALREALRSHGLEAPHDSVIAAPILHDPRGAPVLPEGWTGSISHKEVVAVALARPSEGVRVGVDVEVERPNRIDISRRVMTDDELAELAAHDPSNEARAAWTLQRFSMKEAVYKAIDPFLRRYVGFREVQLEPLRASSGDAWACVFVAPRGDEPRLEIEATIEIVDTEIGRVFTSTALARRV